MLPEQVFLWSWGGGGVQGGRGEQGPEMPWP